MIKCRLITFDGDHEFPFLRRDLFGDILLANPHSYYERGIDRHDGVFNVDLIQQFRDRGDLVGLFFGGHLPQGNMTFRDPRTDQMQWAKLFAGVERMAQ